MGLPGWPPGAGGSSGGGAPPGMGPMAGLGQLVHHPGHPQQHHAMVPHAHVPPGMPAMQPPLSVSQRSSDNGSAGRAVHLPRRCARLAFPSHLANMYADREVVAASKSVYVSMPTVVRWMRILHVSCCLDALPPCPPAAAGSMTPS